jgi:hypothetical protein
MRIISPSSPAITSSLAPAAAAAAVAVAVAVDFAAFAALAWHSVTTLTSF